MSFNAISHTILKLLTRQIKKEPCLSALQITQNMNGSCKITGFSDNIFGVTRVSCCVPYPYVLEDGEIYFEFILMDKQRDFIYVDELDYSDIRRFYTVDDAIKELKTLFTTFKENP